MLLASDQQWCKYHACCFPSLQAFFDRKLVLTKVFAAYKRLFLLGIIRLIIPAF